MVHRAAWGWDWESQKRGTGDGPGRQSPTHGRGQHQLERPRSSGTGNLQGRASPAPVISISISWPPSERALWPVWWRGAGLGSCSRHRPELVIRLCPELGSLMGGWGPDFPELQRVSSGPAWTGLPPQLTPSPMKTRSSLQTGPLEKSAFWMGPWQRGWASCRTEVTVGANRDQRGEAAFDNIRSSHPSPPSLRVCRWVSLDSPQNLTHGHEQGWGIA